MSQTIRFNGVPYTRARLLVLLAAEVIQKMLRRTR